MSRVVAAFKDPMQAPVLWFGIAAVLTCVGTAVMTLAFVLVA